MSDVESVPVGRGATPRLPFMQITLKNFEATFEMLGDALVTALGLIALLVCLELALSVSVVGWDVTWSLNPPSIELDSDQRRSMLVGGVLLQLIGIVATCAIAVAWHRRLLLQERPTGPLPSINGITMRYLLIAIGIALLCAVILMVGVTLSAAPALFRGASDATNPIGIAIIAVALLLVVYVSGRFSIALPHIAIGGRMALTDAWATTTANGWRMTVAIVLTGLAVLVPIATLDFALAPWTLTSHAALVTVLIINAVTQAIIVIVNIGLITHFYMWFRDQSLIKPPEQA